MNNLCELCQSAMSIISANSPLYPVLNGKKVYVHLLFWTTHLLIRIFLSEYHSSDLLTNVWIEITELPIKIFISYFTIFLIEKYIKEWEIWKFIPGILAGFLICWMLKRVHDWYIVYPVYQAHSLVISESFFDFISGLRRLIYIYPTAVAVIAFTYTIEWFQQDRRSRGLKQKHLEQELKYLKSQIQPHFLFNTLNNLYGLSLQNSGKTSEAILQLSELVSFMLYQSDRKAIPLYSEIEMIVNLFELERLRTSSDIEFSFAKPDTMQEILIPPLLLLPLAENAFKFGIGDEDDANEIELTITIENGYLIFETNNRIRCNIKSDQPKNGGFGLKTLAQRLELMYQSDFKLETETRGDFFHAKVIFPINRRQ